MIKKAVDWRIFLAVLLLVLWGTSLPLILIGSWLLL